MRLHAEASMISVRTNIREPATYFEHEAEMGIVGRGMRIEKAFENAAAAVFAMMT